MPAFFSEISTTTYLAAVLGLGIAAQWLAWRLRMPAIVLLLACGFAVGGLVGPPENFISSELLYPLVSLAVGVILFEGGLSLELHEIHETRLTILRLVTVSLLTTWVLSTLAARWILGFSVEIAALLGALLTVSGPTVILPLLRHVHPKRRIGSVVKWEGIINDPIGAILAALVFEVVAHQSPEPIAGESLRNLGMTILVGVLLATAACWLIVQLLRRFWIPDYLQNPVILAVVVILFALSNAWQHESGLLTVTLLGILLANQRQVTVHHVVEFKENLRVLLISVLFILLTSAVQIDTTMVRAVGWQAALFTVVLIVGVRPIAALLATLGSELNWRERVFVGWIHPRGIVAAAVASLFAIELLGTEHAAQAQSLVFVTFAVIVGTVTVYGLTLGPLARRLGLAHTNPQGVLFVGASLPVRDLAAVIHQQGFQTLLIDTNSQKIADARMAGLPVLLAGIGSELVREQTDLGNIGKLLAMTSNDEVNTLATMDFSDSFGSAQVFQLAPRVAAQGRRKSVPQHLRGRLLFGEEATFDHLEQRLRSGAQIKCTAISNSFSYEEFLVRYGNDTLLLMVADDQNLLVNTTDEPLQPKPGQKVIALVGEPSEPTATTVA